MLTQRELQDRIFVLLPTYREELQKLENKLITCGDIDYHFVSSSFARGGMHIFGEAPADHALAGTYVPIFYVPCDHELYVIRNERPEERETDKDFMHLVNGHESCPLCGKPLPVNCNDALVSRDLVLVACPSLKEGEMVVDVLPIFSTTLVRDAWALNLPHQRSQNPMTRVSHMI